MPWPAHHDRNCSRMIGALMVESRASIRTLETISALLGSSSGGFTHEGGAHLHRRRGGFGVDPAGVGDADDEVEITHSLGKDDLRDRTEGLGEVLVALGEVDGVDGGQLDLSRCPPAVDEGHPGHESGVVIDLGDLASVSGAEPASCGEEALGLSGLDLVSGPAAAERRVGSFGIRENSPTSICTVTSRTPN